MHLTVLQEDAAEHERKERERRQKLKQKARGKERTSKERAAAEHKASETEPRTQQEGDAKQRQEEAAVERWGCRCGALAGPCWVQCFDTAQVSVQQILKATAEG